MKPSDELISCINRVMFTEFQRILEAHPELANVQDTNGNTALHLAAKNGNTDFVKALLPVMSKEAINAKNYEDNTVLHLASSESALEVLLPVMPLKAINAKNQEGKTAVDLAKKKDPAIKTLITAAIAEKTTHVLPCAEACLNPSVKKLSTAQWKEGLTRMPQVIAEIGTTHPELSTQQAESLVWLRFYQQNTKNIAQFPEAIFPDTKKLLELQTIAETLPEKLVGNASVASDLLEQMAKSLSHQSIYESKKWQNTALGEMNNVDKAQKIMGGANGKLDAILEKGAKDTKNFTDKIKEPKKGSGWSWKLFG